MDRKRLCVEVVGARNLESPQSVDAYCVVGLCDVKPKKSRGRNGLRQTASPSFRSSTVMVSNSPTWGHVVEFIVPAKPTNVRLKVQLFSEKNFFFDMFPSSNSSSLSEEEANEKDMSHADCTGKEQRKTAVFKPLIDVNGWKGIHDSDSDDVVTLSEEEDEDESEFIDEGDVRPVTFDDSRAPVGNTGSDDELLGVVEINSSLLCKPSRVVTDSWYSLGGTRTGEVRIRTIWYERAKRTLNAQDREMLFEEHVSHSVAKPMTDFYGFAIPELAREDWVHLRSYQDCREERRVEDWTKLYDTQFSERLRRCSFKEKDTGEKTLLLQFARAGIPRHLRERAYMNLSGASEKQENAGSNYYANLVKSAETMETETFRQIELDIDRTFGHSGTTVCSESGRDQLRRILRAYSLRNPAIGYCQGLNFIVAFLMLMADEENVFWLLSVFCEDLYPGYYSPAMGDIQRDMRVLKQLIAEELPQLDEFTSEVGLPLELLGSQWLLCLFTTTFPSETVFRIFDCIFTEGSSFVFPVIMAHLRRMEPTLLSLVEFHDVLASIKDAENVCIDGDLFMAAVCKEAESITLTRVQNLREEQCGSVRSEMERAERARAFNQQLALVYQIPAFSNYAAGLLRFFHEGAEGSSRSDVAFVLTMLCHGLVWLAEHSKRWNPQ
ncbi:Growth hormone-regulated TBC protein 1 [Phytophthora citrophthora]|uniref:Growth hormone-regulated TBC protein 1 n=1 Tax=Phytophthora citrophthora TaxID=4793 RepID=A0AAD9H1G7_9STRA|nr:Growth hormone-regulated TBC protein 1 [Phytophthora citrophthora]